MELTGRESGRGGPLATTSCGRSGLGSKVTRNRLMNGKVVKTNFGILLIKVTRDRCHLVRNLALLSPFRITVTILVLTTSRHETQSSNSVREYSDPPIPDDLLVEIFSRVPARSIARFRCVSKLLVSILRCHDFTELFLTKSLTRPRLLFTIEANGKLFFCSSPQPHNLDDNSSLVATPYHPTLALEPNSIRKPTYTCKHVCGLVLIQGAKRRQCPLICNPAKGKVQTLPKVLRKEKNTPK
ncbi:hypothetical protein YC2023_043061 [Brassica napus]